VLAADDGDGAALARVLPETRAADLAEWSGWLGAVVDLLIEHRPEGVAAAHAALTEDGDPLRATAPVRAQTARLAAWLAWRDGDADAARAAWSRAIEHARSCKMSGVERTLLAERDAH
jgi:hypothetical protein